MKRMFFVLASLAALTGSAAAADLARPAPQQYYKAPVPRWSIAGPASTSVSTAAAVSAVRLGIRRVALTSPAASSVALWVTTIRLAKPCSASKATSTGPTSAAPPITAAPLAVRPATIGCRRCVAASVMRLTASCRSSPVVARSVTSRLPRLASPANDDRAGWTIGGGLEFALAQNWTAKAEYLYVDLGKFNCALAALPTTENVSFTTNLVRAGVNYHF